MKDLFVPVVFDWVRLNLKKNESWLLRRSIVLVYFIRMFKDGGLVQSKGFYYRLE